MPPSPSLFNLPLPEFRSYPGFSQWGVATEIVSAFRSGKRFVCVQAPPGAGKSALAMTVSELYAPKPKRVLYLTVSRGLQDQINEFACLGLRPVKGRANYTCASLRSTCDAPRLFGTPCRDESNCPWREAMAIGRRAHIVNANYALALALSKHGDESSLGDFDLMICDEVHGLLDVLTDVSTLRFSHTNLALAGLTPPHETETDTNNLRTWLKWAVSAEAHVTSCLTSTRDLRTRATLTQLKADLTELADIERAGRHDGNAITEAINNYVLCPELSEHRRGRPESLVTVSIKPKWPGAKRTESLLWHGVPNILMMSGTVAPSIREHLGIAPSSFEWIEVTSSFPVRNRPVIYVKSALSLKIDYRMSTAERKLLVMEIDEIIEAWHLHPGLIHCQSYAYADMIWQLSRKRSKLITHGKGRVREALNQFDAAIRNGDNPVLVSPAVFEGYNLPDVDWIFMLKVPYVDSRDPLTAARKRDDKNYAINLAAQKFLQACFRHIRSESKRGVVLVKDPNWEHFKKSGYFPKYFTRAFRQTRTVPTPEEWLSLNRRAKHGHHGNR